MSDFYKLIETYRDKKDVFVVAELGSNWKTVNDLLSAVNIAKNIGCDAIKYQYLNAPDELYGPKYEINKTFPLVQIKEKCDAAKIEFLCSAFSPEGIFQLDPFVRAHKIASSEMSHIRMLEAVKRTGKPLILSTGAYGLRDIARVLKFMGDYEVILLHCNVMYPTKFTDIDKFKAIQNTFAPHMVGYSDHTTSIDCVPVCYKNLGAPIYEKHFNPFGYTDTPDASHSLNTSEFKAMVTCLRGAMPSFTEENEARLKHLRRVVAIKAILPGEKFKEGDNIGIFRVQGVDEKGANPFSISLIDGKTSTTMFSMGQGIAVSDAI